MVGLFMNPLEPRRALVREKIQENRETYSLTLSLADHDHFSYRPGQFNMLGLPGMGEAPFSFSSLHLERGRFTHTIREAGSLTRSICQLAAGDILSIRGPYGNEWPLEKAKGRHLIIVGGGIGIAPLRPVIRHALGNGGEYGRLYFLLGARTEDDLLFREEFEKLTAGRDGTLLMTVDRGEKKELSHIREGLVTALLDEIDVDPEESITFTCGPELMMRFVARQLIQMGQDPYDIFVSMERRMKCGIAHCGHCQIGAMYVCKDGPIFPYGDIKRFADTML
ncbi:hypothetical protein AMJ71_08080 [candidate division TA06 bacterium SM1_40]|uniref:FAD-binding FR-type domain-containing protein n=1 Tax=candidate division TA06 bacterium SM1_40 TaxID=1703773 RepID=A0A0S8JIB5_UNCT6|nr:MAG: hypothetical protein AMJ71_08080 [candidate division TA06 bacterium SM1_40]